MFCLAMHGYVSIKKQIIFHWITTLRPYWNYWFLQKINWNENMEIVTEKKLEACVKSAKENGWRVSKRILTKILEITEPEQNISLSSKEIIFPEPCAFKGFPTNTMTKNPPCVSHPQSSTIKSMMQSLPLRSKQLILT